MIGAILDFFNLILLQLPYLEDIQGIAEQVRDDQGRLSPKLYDKKGELTDLTIWDKKQGFGYWRKNGSVNWGKNTQDGNIPGRKTQDIVFPLRLVLSVPKKLFGDNNTSEDDLAVSIGKIVSRQALEIKTAIGAQNVQVQVLRYETNTDVVLKAEYSGVALTGVDFKFAYLFIDLNVAITIDPSCIDDVCNGEIDILHAFDFCNDSTFARLTDEQVACLTQQINP